MTTALLLIDLQNHFLEAPGLRPCRQELIDGAATVLGDFRRRGDSVLHVITTIHRAEEAMPHWRVLPTVPCLAGSPGHACPSELEPRLGEIVHHKSGFNAFLGSELEAHLRSLDVRCVVVAGVHLRTCVLTAASEAHQRGFRVLLAAGAIGDDDALHAEVSRQWLEQRGLRFLERQALGTVLAAGGPGPASVGEDSSRTAHASPLASNRPLWEVEHASAERIDRTVRRAEARSADWRGRPLEERRRLAVALRGVLEKEGPALAEQITLETGKPIRASRGEIRFALELIDRALDRARPGAGEEQGTGWRSRRRPHGVVAAITPWNNPVGIPIGKLVPALLHGNTVAWKPAIPGTALARRCLELLEECGLPEGCVGLVEGGALQACRLMEHPAVAAITITGGSGAGMAAQVAATRRRVPLQAELGGNNAAVVWHDTDLRAAAAAITAGAFGSAGQRCTANRRVIVAAAVAEPFRRELHRALEALTWGDPRRLDTVMGPVISVAAACRLQGIVRRAERQGCRIHQRVDREGLGARSPCFLPPTLIESEDPGAECVQEESFGPILVLQIAADWEQALDLCNGVRQGLVAALFSNSPQRQEHFLETARAGILKINASTTGAHAGAPFGGWKESGIGPPEHGPGGLDFYTRLQTLHPG